MHGYDEKNISMFLHELRSPLSSLIAIVKDVDVESSKTEDVKKSFEKIRSIASYLLSLSNNYLEVSKSENCFIETEDKQFKLTEIIEYVVDIARFQFGSKCITLETNLFNEDISFIGKHIKIKQILINLLSNAFKYTPSFGKISLDCKYDYVDDDEVEITLTVRDNGIGMSKSFLTKLFTPYHTEENLINPKGTGLGLYIVLENIKNLNGTINVDSKKGYGTVFTAKFPLKINKSIYDLTGKNFLIIDDCMISQSVIKNYLESVGAVCDIASDGEEGLKKYLDSPDMYYDAIIVDKMMKKLHGDMVASFVRANSRKDAKSIKIIAISASNYKDDIKHCLCSGINDYLLKPFSKESLLQTISK